MLYNDNHNTMYYNVIRDYCMWPLSVLSKLMNPSATHYKLVKSSYKWSLFALC